MNKPFDPKKPCKTRDGRAAQVLSEAANFPDGETLLVNVDGVSRQYFSDGHYTQAADHPLDLVNTIEERIEYRPSFVSARGHVPRWVLGPIPKKTYGLADYERCRLLRNNPHLRDAGIYKLIFRDDILVLAERVE